MSTSQPDAGIAPLAKLRLFLEAVRFQESLFALPFGYLGMILAAGGLPSWWQLLWVTVAMTAVRTLGMSANRIIDLPQDALNPRTAKRALVTGALKVKEMMALAGVSLVVFLVAAAMLNTLALMLAPVAALAVVGYPYVKRYTWVTHFCIGLVDAMAPAGGWIAVEAALPWEGVLLAFAVAMWVGGFDIFYSSQDVEFDRSHGLHTIPQRFGLGVGFWTVRVMHLATVLALLVLGFWMGLGWPYYVGWAAASALLVYEHSIISPGDLSRLNVAFFRVNAYISPLVLVFALASLYL